MSPAIPPSIPVNRPWWGFWQQPSHPQGRRRRQAALAAGYRFAVKVISAGHPLRDYHTTQVPDSVGKFVYRTRRDELVTGKERLGTILSSREYRCDALALVAVVAEEAAPHSLSEIRNALLKPKFHLYLGRKSCPLAAPLNPVLQTAAGFGEALDSYQFGALHVKNMRCILQKKKARKRAALRETSGLAKFSERMALSLPTAIIRFAIIGKAVPMICGPVSPSRHKPLSRHDNPLSRNRWRFSQRVEYLSLGKEGA